jgi:hypothetical protein
VGCDVDLDGNIDSGGWGEIGGNDFIEYNHGAAGRAPGAADC